MKKTICSEMTHSFDQYFACGHSNLRIKTVGKSAKTFIVRGKGSRVWDADGKQYIDYIGAMGPSILGHRHPEVMKTIHNCLDSIPTVLGSGEMFTQADVELGKKIVRHITCAEKIKLCVTGSDAVQTAIRLARAYTGRPLFIRFNHQYHGWPDNVLGGAFDPASSGRPHPKYDLDDLTESLHITNGMSPGAAQESFVLPWNNLEILEQTLKKYSDEIALVHFESLFCNNFCLLPKPGFLKRVKELCSYYGVLVSFDEIITGFRVGLGGAQELFGVTPDMATLGKAIGGGLPLSAVVGRAEIMDQFQSGDVLGPGTFNGFPLAVAAACKTIDVLERNQGAVYKQIAEIQNCLTSGLLDIAASFGINLNIPSATGMFYTAFGIRPDKELFDQNDLSDLNYRQILRFTGRMGQAGILSVANGRWHVSAAHTKEDVNTTLEAAYKVMQGMQSKRQ